MQTRTVFCSACDHDVRVVITDEPSQDGHANLHESEVVCLEIGHHCTGGLCPVGATSPTVMAARLVRNGLQTRMHPVVKRDCVECGGPRDFVVIDRTRAVCAECGAVMETVAPAAPETTSPPVRH